MGNILDSTTGKPIYNDTASGQADYQAAVDYAEKIGNRRRGLSGDRSSFTSPVGLEYYETDTGATWLLTASGWARKQSVPLGVNRLAAPLLLTGSGAPSPWMDLCSVTATSTGGLCTADWRAVQYNASSGSFRTVDFQVVCDGALIGQIINSDSPLISGSVGNPAGFDADSTPGQGSHTWKLQARASIGGACYVKNASLKISEV